MAHVSQESGSYLINGAFLGFYLVPSQFKFPQQRTQLFFFSKKKEGIVEIQGLRQEDDIVEIFCNSNSRFNLSTKRTKTYKLQLSYFKSHCFSVTFLSVLTGMWQAYSKHIPPVWPSFMLHISTVHAYLSTQCQCFQVHHIILTSHLQ